MNETSEVCNSIQQMAVCGGGEKLIMLTEFVSIDTESATHHQNVTKRIIYWNIFSSHISLFFQRRKQQQHMINTSIPYTALSKALTILDNATALIPHPLPY